MSDLNIVGDSCDINCWCGRWQVDNYTFIIETWLTKTQYQNLRDSVRPGAVGELFNILGKPHFYDASWSTANTLTFTPIAGNLLAKMRKPTTGYCKNLISSPLKGDKGHIFCKIEMVVSGSGDL